MYAREQALEEAGGHVSQVPWLKQARGPRPSPSSATSTPTSQRKRRSSDGRHQTSCKSGYCQACRALVNTLLAKSASNRKFCSRDGPVYCPTCNVTLCKYCDSHCWDHQERGLKPNAELHPALRLKVDAEMQ